MQIRLITERATSLGIQRPGQVIDVSDVEAAAMVRSGQAEIVGAGRESNALPAARNAMAQQTKPKINARPRGRQIESEHRS